MGPLHYYTVIIMPTYEYSCSKCGHTFEIVQPITDNALSVCPKESCCRKTWGKGKVKRTISGGAGIIFKGNGFYSTDYRSDKYKADAKKDSMAASSASAASAASASKSETKTEAKPAAKTPAKE